MLPSDVLIAKARPITFHIPTTVMARTDSFNNDLLQIFLNTPLNCAREPHAVPLAIHVTSRPHMGKAEGTSVEVQIVLGWNLNTRCLLILLLDDKYEAWLSDIIAIVVLKCTTFGELKLTIGHLNHIGYIIPLTQHFLTRLRLRINKSRHTCQQLSLNQKELADLDLWLCFLQHPQGGILLNRITTRKPSKSAGRTCVLLVLVDAYSWEEHGEFRALH
jgi:hypothetical protein